ncbi:MAG: nucleoside triphosphate pyrophosphohydrolase [Hyphomicrobiales bacterium]|nr:nucleoside triphosphate pyrophosphohydrolase [Hyphomicrobiales bacterium]MBV9519153.1 nucleoside triphosphate pyrophosphohydrolase [Hyphomicrobiales bacterium]
MVDKVAASPDADAPALGAGKERGRAFAPSRNVETLLAIMAALRDKNTGCPWDVAQSFATIAPYTIEEAYEVADAIAQGDMRELREELGDLLLQVVFHAQMGREAGLFDFGDVVEAISEKLIRRHPHVFGHRRGAELDEVNAAWERIKREEKTRKKAQQPESLLDDIALALPALTRAEKLQSRAARVGFDWTTPQPILAKLREELTECEAALGAGNEAAILDEIGDLLFTVANLARRLGVDAEAAARGANAKFERRFRAMEADVSESGREMKAMSLDELEALWVAAKHRVG